MFIDHIKIHIQAGDGGKGCMSFRREKFVPYGGPDGGDGGNGGDVIFIADPNVATLLDFFYRPILKAKSGNHGKGANKTGESGKSLTVKVPIGTLIRKNENGEVLFDFNEEGKSFVVAKGGRGGRGNARFATSINQSPTRSDPGDEGDVLELFLELRLIADVGVVGFPNAGKSTFISRISNAKPKIAEYPFTTLNPILGVVRFRENADFVIADMPGLVEGAHKNVGLGHEFLRHIQRTKCLLFLIDASEIAVPDPKKAIETLLLELAQYDESLLNKPRVIAVSKMDLPQRHEKWDDFQSSLNEKIHFISSLTGLGIDDLLKDLYQNVVKESADA